MVLDGTGSEYDNTGWYLVSISWYCLVLIRWYMVSKGLVCLYILEKSGDLVGCYRCLTDRQQNIELLSLSEAYSLSWVTQFLSSSPLKREHPTTLKRNIGKGIGTGVRLRTTDRISNDPTLVWWKHLFGTRGWLASSSSIIRQSASLLWTKRTTLKLLIIKGYTLNIWKRN